MTVLAFSSYNFFSVDFRHGVFFININRLIYLFSTIYNKSIFEENNVYPVEVVDRKGPGL